MQKKKEGFRCSERLRDKIGGENLVHTRWSGAMGYLRRGKYYFRASVVISLCKPPLPNLDLLFLPTRRTSKVICTRSTTSRTNLKVLRTGRICGILASCTLLLVVTSCCARAALPVVAVCLLFLRPPAVLYFSVS